MKFANFIKKGTVRKGLPDRQLAKSLIKTATHDLSFLQKLKINEESARKILVSYYDTLRSVLEAITALEGYKVYSHEAFTYYLKEREEDFRTFDRVRKIRNGINYYGKTITPEEVKQHKEDILRLITQLKQKYVPKG